MGRDPAKVKITPSVIAAHHITPDEYAAIQRHLERDPTITELGIYSVMWSEHCSYKSSRAYLKQLPTKGKRLLVAAGEENAGVVELRDGWAVCFKVESHNHPSAVEPHEGAATGVGGILRDILTMGARPVALLNSLRFGPLNGEGRTRFLVGGVIKGIADYGNCVGVPTVGGEIYFDPAYRHNPLVNVMCVGVMRTDRLARARAAGAGNPVLYVGARTGRDGLGGASFASRQLSAASLADRPAVQVGDPFTEKLLIEATLEALATGDVVAIQDMGAAGLTCSTSEMAGRGGTGLEIDLDRVPQRERGMTAYDIMLSESQERMLLVVNKPRLRSVQQVFEKWGLSTAVIGKVTDGGRLRVSHQGGVVADIPVTTLTTEAPCYQRPAEPPKQWHRVTTLGLSRLREPRDWNEALTALMGHPTLASKAWAYEQYDHMVRTNTVLLPGGGASVIRIKGSDQLLALTLDGNATYCYLDPYIGGKIAVAEAARNLACVGATPLAVTDCLNFGNPEQPMVMWQFAQCVKGVSEACSAFNTPVTGGNVSFYNEHPNGAIDPTPVIGMVGVLQPPRHQGSNGSPWRPINAGMSEAGDAVIVLGETYEELGGSAYLQIVHEQKRGGPPNVSLEQEQRLQKVLIKGIAQGWVSSAQDCAEGGLAVALAEQVLAGVQGLGMVLEDGRTRKQRQMRVDAWLFGESQARAVVTCAEARVNRLAQLAEQCGVPWRRLGTVGGQRLIYAPWIDVGVAELRQVWSQAIPQSMGTAFRPKMQSVIPSVVHS